MAKDNGLLPSVNISVNLQVRYLVAALFIGPMFGLAWGFILAGIAWLLAYGVPFLQCWVAGWLVTTVAFCVDIRRNHDLLFLELEDRTEDPPAEPPKPLRPREVN